MTPSLGRGLIESHSLRSTSVVATGLIISSVVARPIGMMRGLSTETMEMEMLKLGSKRLDKSTIKGKKNKLRVAIEYESHDRFYSIIDFNNTKRYYLSNAHMDII